MKGLLKKLIIIISIVAILAIGYGVDYAISKTYSVEFVSVNRVENTPLLNTDGTPIPKDVGITDGNTNVRFLIKLTHKNKAVGGHVLYIKTNRNVVGRMITDDNGIVEFDYRCYLSSTASDVEFNVQDENNSIFIFVPTEGNYTLKMMAPVTDNPSNMTTNDVFYDIDEDNHD